MISKLVIFGATGDLTERFLLPAIAALAAAEKLPTDLQIVAVARQDQNDEKYCEYARHHLEQYAAEIPSEVRLKLASSMVYRKADVTDPREVADIISGLAGADKGAIAVYLALPTALIASTVQALAAGQLPEGSRVVVEKPFGEDLESAIALNRLLKDLFGDRDIVYRVDHFLGIAAVQNIVGMRAANRFFEQVWSSDHIQQMEILWDETLGLEGRASFYDKAGALRDVIQNHLMQILSLITMELPSTLDPAAVTRSKIEVLRDVRKFTDDEAAERSCRARFTAGNLADGRALPAYIDEEGVDAGRGTETFAEIELEIGNARWKGTRFILRTGKALKEPRKAVVVHFRPMPASLMDGNEPPAAELYIGIEEPAEIVLSMIGALSNSSFHPVPIKLAGPAPLSALPAYSQVILDVLSANSRLAVHPEEAEEAWRIVMPFLTSWSQGKTKLGEYAAGSARPDC